MVCPGILLADEPVMMGAARATALLDIFLHVFAGSTESSHFLAYSGSHYLFMTSFSS